MTKTQELGQEQYIELEIREPAVTWRSDSVRIGAVLVSEDDEIVEVRWDGTPMRVKRSDIIHEGGRYHWEADPQRLAWQVKVYDEAVKAAT